MRTVILTVGALLGITLWGMAVYTDGANAGNVPADGYGVSRLAG